MAQCMDETQAPRLILGSGSPRRLEILAVLGITPDAVTPPDIDETPQKAELPRPYCMRMAREKALAVNAAAGDLVLSADTTVAAGRRILGKPEDEAEAVAFLRLLSGRRHRVITALAIRKDAQVWAADVVTAVKMKRLSDAEISAYIRSGEWQGKAGGYTIQGRGGAFIPWISGSHTAVMGLPIDQTYKLLRAAGYPLDVDAP
jgi:septum formation protein